MFKVTEIEKKIRWVYGDNEKHYYKKNTTTNTWDEYENSQEIKNTFIIRTYYLNKILLKHQTDDIYVELSDNQASIVFSSLEALDNNNDKYAGYWVILTGDERKNEIFSERSHNLLIGNI